MINPKEDVIKQLVMVFSNEKEKDELSKCDIIDIANEEMKNIDSSKIDSEFKQVFTEETTQKFIDLVAKKRCKQKDIDEYKKRLNDDDILDVRVTDTLIYIKTPKSILPITLSSILQVKEEMIEEVPITARFNFYVIQSSKWSSPDAVGVNYIPEHFIEELQHIGSKEYNGNDGASSAYLLMHIIDAIFDSDEKELDDMEIDVDIEDQVVAIKFNKTIFDIKEIMSRVLKINPVLFIEIVTPIGTALLIDTRRWVLDEEFGEEQWYL